MHAYKVHPCMVTIVSMQKSVLYNDVNIKLSRCSKSWLKLQLKLGLKRRISNPPEGTVRAIIKVHGFSITKKK